MVDMLPEWPVDMLDMRYQNEALLEVRHCNDQGVALFYNNKVVKFADGKLFIESTKDGEVKELPADVIVLSVGVKPNDALCFRPSQRLEGGRCHRHRQDQQGSPPRQQVRLQPELKHSKALFLHTL